MARAGRPSKLNKKELDTMLEEYAAGQTAYKLAEKYGISYSSVRYHLERKFGKGYKTRDLPPALQAARETNLANGQPFEAKPWMHQLVDLTAQGLRVTGAFGSRRPLTLQEKLEKIGVTQEEYVAARRHPDFVIWLEAEVRAAARVLIGMVNLNLLDQAMNGDNASIIKLALERHDPNYVPTQKTILEEAPPPIVITRNPEIDAEFEKDGGGLMDGMDEKDLMISPPTIKLPKPPPDPENPPAKAAPPGEEPDIEDPEDIT